MARCNGRYFQWCRPVRGVVVVAGVVFFAATVAIPAISAIKLAPHRAIYEVKLLKASRGGNVADAHGAISIEWQESCHAWNVDQRFRLGLALDGGHNVETDITFSSSEFKDGSRYSFNSKTTRNGRQTGHFQGKVARPSPNTAAIVRYNQPKRMEVSLPAGTMFPMQHTQAILNAAARGEPRISAHFFEGPRPEDSPFLASTMILGGPNQAQNGVAGDYGNPIDLMWWRIRVALFTGLPDNTEPDFEFAIDLQQDGIARAITFDYQEFSLTGDLRVVERLPRPDCP